MKTQETHAAGETRVLGSNHAAFAGCDGLRGIKGKTSYVAYSPDSFTLIARREGMCGISDDLQAITRGNLENGIEFMGVSRIVNRKNRFGTRSNRSLDETGIHVEGIRRRVHQDRAGAKVKNNLPGSGEGHSWK